ncbi:beta-lactamase-like protein [Cladochytrium replicatum]|nr:beta-lactamase-like protein [Cladochytrium replicatum]
MKFHLQILATHLPDAKPAVLLHFDTQRYLFNCGEGTQRFCHENGVNLGKLRNVFVSRINWDVVGGLPGLLLTLAGAGATDVKVHGPTNLTHFLASTRHFIFRHMLKVDTHEFPLDGVEYQDSNVRIQPIAINPTFHNNTSPVGQKRKSEDSTYDAAQLPSKRILLKRMFPAGTFQTNVESSAEFGEILRSVSKITMEPARRDDTVLAFLCKGPEVPGKFDAKKAIQLGLKAGPDFGKLARGETVTAPNGTEVHPSDVIGPSRAGASFLIIDCPSQFYIDDLSSNPVIRSARKSLVCAVHVLGKGVFSQPRYKDFMRTLSGEQLVIDEDRRTGEVVFKGAAEMVGWLRAVDSEVWSGFWEGTPQSEEPLPPNCNVVRPLTTFVVEPAPQIDVSTCLPKFNMLAMNSFEQTAKLASSMEKSLSTGWSVTTLGTGSAIPGRLRNVSSTLVETPRGAILLDAGEATWGQIQRAFMKSTSDITPVASLCLIFISHLHADHHLGTVSVIKAWCAAPAKKSEQLVVVAPFSFHVWLQEYGSVEALNGVRFVSCEDIMEGETGELEWANVVRSRIDDGRWFLDHSSTLESLGILKATLGVDIIKAIPVIHCPHAFGLVLDDDCGHRLVYSGDCRPTPALIEHGQDATVLIHEATLSDAMQTEALEKKHCTISEAIRVGMEMKAHVLILTHFSQRYPKYPHVPALPLPTLSPAGEHLTWSPSVIVASDLMRIPVDDAPERFPKIMKRLGEIFAGEIYREE